MVVVGGSGGEREEGVRSWLLGVAVALAGLSLKLLASTCSSTCILHSIACFTMASIEIVHVYMKCRSHGQMYDFRILQISSASRLPKH